MSTAELPDRTSYLTVPEAVTHEQLQAALDAASKEKLVLALRALLTAQAWKQTPEVLRNALIEAAHDEESSHEEVYNAVVNGA